VAFKFKERYSFEDLLEITEILRGEKGCPWDREQTHESIRKNFIEETYEAVEAIDNNDPALLEEELGDVLMQVALHAQIEKESGEFDMGDVVDGICKKLIIRHPHVFGGTVANTSSEVLKNWQEIKKRQKNQKTQAEALKTVPKVLPALMRSYKVQQRAAEYGFDWPSVHGAIEKTHEELGEFEAAIAAGVSKSVCEELGDLLFSVVNLSRFADCEPEEALTRACDKFIERFEEVEKLASEQGVNLKAAGIDELDRLWDAVKNKP
jgi:tetrapyrrole methylase family protein/MazG family protein